MPRPSCGLPSGAEAANMGRPSCVLCLRGGLQDNAAACKTIRGHRTFVLQSPHTHARHVTERPLHLWRLADAYSLDLNVAKGGQWAGTLGALEALQRFRIKDEPLGVQG